jgi:hypothetical protein
MMTCTLLAPTVGAFAAGAHVAASPARQRGVICQRRHGQTILRRGIVRVFRASDTVWGCVKGSTSVWPLWETEDDFTQGKGGAVKCSCLS